MKKEQLEELEELFDDISNDMMPPYVSIDLDTIIEVKNVIGYAKELENHVKELEKQSKHYRQALKRIRLACNFSDEDKDEIVPTVYEEVDGVLRGDWRFE